MSATRSIRTTYPLLPLLSAFRRARAEQPEHWTPQQLAETDWLTTKFLDTVTPDQFADQVSQFHHRLYPICWHPLAVRTHRSLLRHSLVHLLRGGGTLAERLDRCRRPGGTYFVPGLGRRFWAVVAQAIEPSRPAELPEVEAGARRVGLFDRGALIQVYDVLLANDPSLTAADLDRFLSAVGRMTGRELVTAPDPARALPQALRVVRNRVPLRRRLADVASPVTDDRPVETVFTAVREEFATSAATAAVAGRDGLVALSATALVGLAVVDDAFVPGLAAVDELSLLRDGIAVLRDRYRVHPLETNDVLELFAAPTPADDPDTFRGFCSDTFRFFAELTANNNRDWMNAHRDRYRFAVREPVVELCEELGERYVRPILGGEYGWRIECDPKPGRAVTSICKNDYGRSSPYVPEMWVTFYPTGGGRAVAPQLYVKADANGVAFGFHLGRQAREAGKRLRTAVQQHAALLFDALAVGEVPSSFTFTDGTNHTPIRGAEDLRTWAAGRTLTAERRLSPDSPTLRTDELVGEVLLAFDRLLPLFGAAVEADAAPLLRRRAGRPDRTQPFDRAAFLADTFLPECWLDRTLGLLKLKKQLVLQGVPGTGKTHVARGLARLLTHDRADAVRFVQFHPAYTYSEFVESVTPGADGPTVRDGLLISFAAVASKHPAETFALVIDDMARANLPAVFGELLYLLEYRGQSVTLPFSQRVFRLPANLYLIGTLNPSDAAVVGQPLRRRFGFVDMPPDAALLARWFEANPPADPDPAFGPRLVRLFEQLNRRLARDLGADRQLGHSLFMLPGMDAAKLRAVWEHHVRPMLADAGRPDRLMDLDLDQWLAARQAFTRYDPTPRHEHSAKVRREPLAGWLREGVPVGYHVASNLTPGSPV